MSGAKRLRRCDWRWLWRSPLLIAAVALGVTSAWVFLRAFAALQEGRRLRAGIEVAAARLAAETAAAVFVDTGGTAERLVVDAGRGIEVQTSAAAGKSADEVRLLARVGEHSLQLTFPKLAGGTSWVFGLPLVARAGVELPAGWPPAMTVSAGELPQLVPEATRAPLPASIARDAGVALMHLPAGTDRDDFVLGKGIVGPVRLPPPPGGVIFVPGNLWVPAARGPLNIELSGDLTILVRGNIYLGNSVRVTGRGCLILATMVDGGTAFADLDGNGRWSAGDRLTAAGEFTGPIEGSGAVYLGLPRGTEAKLGFELGLVVGGELHVAADRVCVHGPLILAGGATALPGHKGGLEVTGRRLPALGRAILPGFVPTGSPRPGLVRVDDASRQTLYLAAPGR